jgi:hypothetical protein
MKYIYLSIFLSLLISSTICENTSFLKNSNKNTTTPQEEPEPKSYNGYCFMKMKNQFFNLRSFNLIKPWKVTDIKGNQVQFNFCSNIDTTCHQNDALIADPKNCKKFAGKSDQEKTWTLSTDAMKQSVLTVKFPSGDSCAPGKNYQTTLVLTCDKKSRVPVITNDKTFDETKCENVIRMTSRNACTSGRFSAWWNQFGIPKQGLAGILIFIGLYFIIFGVYNWKTNSILINCGILGLILYSFLSLFTKINLGLCMIMGIGIALIAFSFPSFNAALLGVVVGYLFGSLLYNLLVKVIHVNPQALYWTILTTCIVLISVAGGFMDEYMVILATSLVGSYALVRGISVYAGGYPDETYVMMLINNGEYSQFGRVFGPKIYLYIGGIFVMTAIGFWIQTYMIPAKPATEEKLAEKKEEEKTAEKKDDPIKTTSAAENNTVAATEPEKKEATN